MLFNRLGLRSALVMEPSAIAVAPTEPGARPALVTALAATLLAIAALPAVPALNARIAYGVTVMRWRGSRLV